MDNNDQKPSPATPVVPPSPVEPQTVLEPDAATVPPPPVEKVTDGDASTGEIICYSLGSVAGNFAGSTLHIIGPILMIVFKLNALLFGLISSINLIWDAFTDPLMASITDNFRSKWGRRRPFILVAGVLLPLVSVFGWMFIPRTSKVEPNMPVIPIVESSDAVIANFGNMLLAYNTDKLAIHARPIENATEKELPAALDEILKKAVAKMNASLVWTDEAAADSSPDIVIFTKVTGVSDDITEAAASSGFEVAISMQAIAKSGKTIARHSARVSIGPRLELKEAPRTFAQKIGALARRETEKVGLSYASETLQYQANIARERGRHRALVAVVDAALVEVLGEHFAVPYWRCFPAASEASALLKDRLRQSLPQAREQYLPQLKALVYASGHNVDLKSRAWSPAEWQVVDQLRQEAGAPDDAALFVHLWENLSLEMGEARIRFFRNPPAPKKQQSLWSATAAGITAFRDSSAEDRRLALYALGFLLVMSTVRTVFGVPYYALGIELAPSYHGRTKVVAWRSIFEKIVVFKNPWLMPICLLAVFTDAAQGAMFLSIIFTIIAVPMVIAASVKTKERTHVDKSRKKVPFLRSLAHTVNNRHFWKIVGLYVIVQTSLGIFGVVGMFVTIYYVFRGDLLLGSTYGAILGSMGTGIALAGIPLVAWMCRKYQKHNAMRVAIIMMMIGCVLKWWCYNPDYPELMFIEAFFFSLGISSVYTILSTLMADVTDVDELMTGSRREGMFGAVNSWLMKGASAFTAIASGIVVVVSGFDVNLGIHQAPGVFTTMRIMFSVMPATLLSLALLILYKYPLTEQRMREIKEQLRLRKASPPPATT
jgi:GPH family glycoside/pentoside/hexuronide:cation symporter